MPTVPNTLFNTLSPPSRLPMVFVSSDLDADPTMAEYLAYARNVVVRQSAGGRDLDYCRFEFDLAAMGVRLVDLRQQAEWNRIVVVTLPDDVGNPIGFPLFWGELTKQNLQLAPHNEAAIGTARLEDYHFGERPAWGMEVLFWDGADFVPREWHYDAIEANPLVDDQVHFNRSSEKHPDDEEHYVWIDPESVRNQLAMAQQGGQYPVEFDLREFLTSVCWMQNKDEDFVLNPITATGSTPLPIFDDAARLVDVRLPVAERLPKLLDALLEPRGYSWFIKREFEAGVVAPDLSVTSRIVVFKRGEGTKKAIWFQRPDTVLNPATQNAEIVDATMSISDLANRIEVFGSLQEREVTLELYRLWTPTEDNLPLEVLDRVEGLEFEAHPNAWRLWGANLSGEYSGITGPRHNAAVAPIPASARDLTVDVFRDFDANPSIVPKRRKFGPCLTLGPDGERLPPQIEWHDGTEWKAVPQGWQCHIRTDRDEIYFSAAVPPDELHAMGPDARLRVTCTLIGDQRVRHLTDRSDTSPNGRDLYLSLRMAHRFHDRLVQATGDFKSVLHDDHHFIVTAVTAGSGGTGAFTVAEDLDGELEIGDTIRILSAIANSGRFIVAGLSITDGGPSVITVREQVVASVGGAKLCIRTTEQDDWQKIGTYADDVRTIDDAAELELPVSLFGIHVGYEIGDLIDKIDGRNIALNRASEESGEERFLQVVARQWDFQTQTTILELASFDVTKKEAKTENEEGGW